ncbi:MAG: tetratricopeptide repeat protein [Leptolyngbya sp. RL_3_1]|nr:tetratricopeptide repeat protein [Leptolyngbya sp. RL_3_1]
MTTDLLDWHEDDQTVDPEAEYRMLLNGLRRTEGFGLFFVQCSPFGGEQIIQRVQADLADQSVAVLKLDAPIEDGNVFKRIRDCLDTQPETQVLFIQGLELSLLDYEESKKRLGWSSEKIFSYSWQGVPPVLINLNQQRERFRDSFNIRLVFLLPVFAVKYLVHRAPDFFDWRSGIFPCSDTDELVVRKLVELSKNKDYGDCQNWPQSKRNSEILRIQSLIESSRDDINKLCFLYGTQGNLLATSGQHEEASERYTRVTKLQPNNHKAWSNLGGSLFFLKRLEDAIMAFNYAISINSDLFEVWLLKGVALNQLNRHLEAAQSFDRASQIKAEVPEAWLLQGDNLLEIERYEEAVNAYQKALENNIKDKETTYKVWLNMGEALRRLSHHERAIESFNHALSINSESPEALNNKGLALVEKAIAEATEVSEDNFKNDVKNGICLYEKSLSIKPDKHETWNNKGIALGKIGCIEEAIYSFDQAISIEPCSYEYVYNKACCYGSQGNAQDAVQVLKEAINLHPKCREMAKTDPDFDLARHDPHFKALLADQGTGA